MKMFVNVSRTRQNAREDYREDCATLTFEFISLKNKSITCKVKLNSFKVTLGVFSYYLWCFISLYLLRSIFKLILSTK